MRVVAERWDSPRTSRSGWPPRTWSSSASTWAARRGGPAGAAGDAGGERRLPGGGDPARAPAGPAPGHPGAPRRLIAGPHRLAGPRHVGRPRVGGGTRCGEWRCEVGQDGATAHVTVSCRAAGEGGAVGDVLWTPPADVRERSRIGDYLRWLASDRGLDFADYDELWRWSVDDLAGVLALDLGLLRGHRARPRRPRRWPTRAMPGAALVPRRDAQLRRARAADARASPTTTRSCSAYSQTRAPVTLTAARAARAGPPGPRPGCAGSASAPGDRVAAYAPNIPETFVLMLATASLGAIFSSCAPEFGTRSVTDRWQQIEPTVLVAVDGYRYGDKAVDRRAEVAAIRAALPVAAHTSCICPTWTRTAGRRVAWAELAADTDEPLAFDAGAVRPPALRALLLRHDRPAQADRARPRRHPAGAPEDARPAPRPGPGRPVLLVHHHRLDDVELPGLRPGGRRGDRHVRRQPGPPRPGRAVAAGRGGRHHLLRHLGAVPAGLPQGRASCRGSSPTCPRCAALGSTGAPLPPEGFALGVRGGRRPTLQLQSLSGGTDVCTGFVGGVPLLPVYEGEIACRCLGRQGRGVRPGRHARSSASSASWSSPRRCRACRSASGTTRTARRYREAYFDVYPGRVAARRLDHHHRPRHAA